MPGTSLTVSPVALGCWALGGEGWGEDISEAQADATVQAALAAGITLFDTAPIYGRGQADRRLARALGPRIHEVVVATKAGPRFEGDHPISDLSAENLRRDVEGSLARLGLACLPLLQIHWPCEQGTPLLESLEALERLREEGLIAHIGLCNYGPDALEEARRAGHRVMLQTPLSLVRRDYEHGLMEAARATETPVLAYEPLARGMLTGKFRALPTFPKNDVRHDDPRFWAARFGHFAPRVERLRQIANKVDASPAALAVAWAASRPRVVSALAGAKSPEQIRESAEALSLLARPGAQRVLDAVGRAV
ncbi:MAG: aldo/keto reductase [Sandaracinaceae bacterium]